MPTYVIYARKSSESEDRQVLSIEAQLKELRALARSQGLSVRAEYTESMSAKAPGRPHFTEVLEATTNRTADGILCWKLDRLARNPVDGAALIWALDQGKLAEIVTPGRTFTNRGDDKFWMQMEFGIAKKFVDDLSDNVKRGNRAKLEQGWLPGIPPVGYMNDREHKTIIPDPERFPLVRKMWDLVLSGTSPAEVLRKAKDDWGFRTRPFKRSGGVPLAPSTFYKLLSNPFYYGLIVRNAESYPGAHQAMITKAEFDKVQEIMKRPGRPRPKRHRFAYTGLIRCGECGASVTAENQVNRQGHRYVYYHCTKRLRDTNCSQRMIRVEALEDQIAGFLGTLQVSEQFRDWALQYLEKARAEEKSTRVAATASLRASLEDIERQLDRLMDLQLRAQITDEEFASKRKALVERQLGLRQKLKASETSLWFEPTREVILLAHEAPRRFRTGSPDERRQLLRNTAKTAVLLDRRFTAEPQEPFRILAGGGRSTRPPKPVPVQPRAPTNRWPFEPSLHPTFRIRNDRLAAVIPSWCAIVDDIRTFFIEHSGWPCVSPLFKSEYERGYPQSVPPPAHPPS